MAELGYDRLSMSDVARRADLNRGTLYLHFTDKYDMLERFEDEAIDAVARILFKKAPEQAGKVADEDAFDPEQFVGNERILAALRFVQSDAAFFTALTGEGGDPLFAERFKETLSDHIIEEAEREKGASVGIEGIPLAYAREIALGSIIAIIMLWLKRGATESAELIAHIIDIAKHTAPLDLLALPPVR